MAVVQDLGSADSAANNNDGLCADEAVSFSLEVFPAVSRITFVTRVSGERVKRELLTTSPRTVLAPL